ncbi:MAG: hypothetical protein E6Q98_13540 [Rhodospirillaceae bacterium]|nr:MAG: hypothetical protein E6Q98_13540 [Rhodospirillaceae bacterium]
MRGNGKRRGNGREDGLLSSLDRYLDGCDDRMLLDIGLARDPSGHLRWVITEEIRLFGRVVGQHRASGGWCAGIC